MKKIIIFATIITLCFFNSCREPIVRNQCPFSHIFSSEFGDSRSSSQNINANIDLSLNKMKKLPGINIDVHLQDSIVLYNHLRSERQFVEYPPEFISKHNAIIDMLCITYHRIADERTDSTTKADLNTRFNSYVDRYVDLLLSTHGNHAPLVDTTIQENTQIDNSIVNRHQEKIKVPSSEAERIDTIPFRETAQLTIRTQPENASIFINNVLYGISNKTIELPYGDYTIRITKPGFLPLEDMINIPNRKLIMKTLEKIEL